MERKIRKCNQSGFSLAEALVGIAVSTIVMTAAGFIYNNFQQTFIRQINHNVIKQEVRFAIHALQLDLKMAGYKHEDAANGIQRAVYLTDSSNIEVGEQIEADIVYVCYDSINNNNTSSRKIIKYELRKKVSSNVKKTVLMKKTYNTNDCVNKSDANEPNWEPVAEHFKKFRIIKTNNILNLEIEMEDPGEKIVEKYNAAAFMRNTSY
tara:strand:- start:8 stop:631 length:624 start_codon:yes stop_codon:yes gene_type:complete